MLLAVSPEPHLRRHQGALLGIEQNALERVGKCSELFLAAGKDRQRSAAERYYSDMLSLEAMEYHHSSE
jgi:hypothetical protein